MRDVEINGQSRPTLDVLEAIDASDTCVRNRHFILIVTANPKHTT